MSNHQDVVDLMNENAKLHEQLVLARAALEPFAGLAAAYEGAHRNKVRRYVDEGHPEPKPHPDSHRVSVSMGELRAAKAALTDN